MTPSFENTSDHIYNLISYGLNSLGIGFISAIDHFKSLIKVLGALSEDNNLKKYSISLLLMLNLRGLLL